MTRQHLAAIAVCCALWTASAEASPHGRSFGLGLALGSPTSLTGKFFLDRSLALDFALDFARFSGSYGLHADILWHTPALVSNSGIQLPLYFGGGLQLGFWRAGYGYDWRWGYYPGATAANFALRGVFGMAIWLQRVPLEFFVEIGPEVWFLYSGIGVFGSLGARYYF